MCTFLAVRASASIIGMGGISSSMAGVGAVLAGAAAGAPAQPFPQQPSLPQPLPAQPLSQQPEVQLDLQQQVCLRLRRCDRSMLQQHFVLQHLLLQQVGAGAQQVGAGAQQAGSGAQQVGAGAQQVASGAQQLGAAPQQPLLP